MTKDTKAKGPEAPKDAELTTQISSMWSEAQTKLNQLKAAVAENHRVKELKARLDDAQAERDRKVMALGELALKAFSQDEKSAPSALKLALEAVKNAEKQLQNEKSSIRDLLAEAEVVKKPAPAPKKK